MAKKANDFFQQVKDLLDGWYASKDIDHIWTGKENKHLGMLISTLKKLYKRRHGRIPGPEELTVSLMLIFNNLPEWYLLNSPTVASINGNIINIVQKIKNERNQLNTERKAKQLLTQYYNEQKQTGSE